MADVTKIRTMGTLEDYNPQGTHHNTLYQVEGTDTILYNGKPLSNEEVERELKTKANIDLLSNVLGSEVVDEQTFPDIHTLTRDDLKRDLFDDLWCELGRVGTEQVSGINKETGLYWLEDVNDIEYEEAIKIYIACQGFGACHDGQFFNSILYGLIEDLRAIFPLRIGGLAVNTFGSTFRNSKITKIRLCGNWNGKFRCERASSMFHWCTNLKEIIGTFVFTSTAVTNYSSMFSNTNNVEEFRIENLGCNFNINNLSKASSASIRFLIANAVGTNTITLTLHSDVYNKIVSNEEEWNGILDLAMSKNISIASA